MQQAFSAKAPGPLTDTEVDGGKQEAAMYLFSRAIGLFKNPTSHRAVSYDDPGHGQRGHPASRSSASVVGPRGGRALICSCVLGLLAVGGCSSSEAAAGASRASAHNPC